MKSAILSLMITVGMAFAVFAQGERGGEASSLTELHGMVAGEAADVPAAAAPKAVVHSGSQHGLDQRITRFQSGEFRFSSEARESLGKALESLKTKGIEVLEAEVGMRSYAITFVSSRPAKVVSFESREYTYRFDAEGALQRLTEALERSGAVVLESNLKDVRSFRVQYIETDRNAMHRDGQRAIEFRSAEFSTDSAARKSMRKALGSLAEAGCEIIESEERSGSYAITFLAPAPVRMRVYLSQEYDFSTEAERAMEHAAQALENSGAAIAERTVTPENKFSLKYFELREAHLPPLNF